MTNLMDAKAKVVAWRYVDQNGFLRVSLDRNWHGTECTPLIPLTDHESALADLRGKLNDALGATHGYMQALAAVEQKHQTLFTGLEALAYDMNNSLGHDDHGSYISEQTIVGWAERLSTLASEAKK